ncbi:MAG: glycosyltransferase family 2 protein [Candidatus Hydrogenedens sp.]|jgi:dolichol-phosphate mannosyltransferase|nr:glycosyltransferase family 2 protein [Candidatus Hydrogenedens sp.]
MNTTPKYSFVLPAFNEDENVAIMTERLLTIAEKLDGAVEILWVNDGSTDGTATQLDRLTQDHDAVRALHFSRNFGHMAALCAGLEGARASHAVITLDADGQHPPEMIPEMIRHWKDGADIVQCIRQQASERSLIKKATSGGFYKIFNLLADTDIPEGAADFRLMSREVVDALNTLPERVRFVRGLVHWVGFHQLLMPYEEEKRLTGTTKYSMRHMLSFALNGITSFSIRPLRLSFVLSLLVIGLIALYSAYVLVAMVSGKYISPGWTSLVFVVLFLGAAQLLVIGIASEYLARLYVEQKRRPVYILRKPISRREEQ